MSPRMPNYDALRAQEAKAKEAGFQNPADVDAAMRSIEATMIRFAKAMDELGASVRIVNLGQLRQIRRPALIHKGGKP